MEKVTSDDIGPDGIVADTVGIGMVVETIMKGVGKVLGGSKRELEVGIEKDSVTVGSWANPDETVGLSHNSFFFGI